MTFYIVLILIFYALFTLADYKWPNIYQRKILTILPCVILFLVAVLRFDVGYDYPAYYDISPEESERFERLSSMFVDITRSLDRPYILFILFGLPTYLLAFMAFRKTESFQLAFWTYVFLFLLESFGTIRQAAAMSVVLYSIEFLRKKRLLWYILMCVLASMLHAMALIMLPAYFIYHYCSWKFVIFSLLGLAVCFPYLIDILDQAGYYSFYIRNMDLYEGGSFIRFFYILLYVSLMGLSYKLKILKETKPYFVVLLPAFIFPFLLGGHFGGRLSSFYYLFFIYLIPYILSNCRAKVKMIFMLILSFFFLAFLYVSQRAGDKSPYTPYKTIFEVDLEHPHFK